MKHLKNNYKNILKFTVRIYFAMKNNNKYNEKCLFSSV